jgi:hypothetical protein
MAVSSKIESTEKIEVRFRKDLAARLPAGQSEKNEFINRAVEHELNGRRAAVPLPKDSPFLLNLFVEDQNTAIGRRNIHMLKSGSRFSVGGGNSDFLIFLVPIPPAIGEVRRDGGRCVFVPLKPRYFPDLGSGELPDCIGKTIRIISDKYYELRFRLEYYEDPLIPLNRLLNSVRLPD